MEQGNFRGFEVAVHEPGIAVITFNQPERLNGTTQPMKRDLVETLLQAQMDDQVRVVVITGSGRGFCAGDSLGGPAPSGEAKALVADIPGGHNNAIGTYEGLRAISQPLNVALRQLDKISIAAINGVAIQTGLRFPYRLHRRASRQRHAPLRPPPRRRRPVPPRPGDGRGEDDGFPHA